MLLAAAAASAGVTLRSECVSFPSTPRPRGAPAVHLLNTETGAEEGAFASGDSPHENTYSEDGSKICHASIGLARSSRRPGIPA